MTGTSVLFEGMMTRMTGRYSLYSVDPGGDRFYFVKPDERYARPTELIFALNWAGELADTRR
ncbi:MAG: hypothetical protein ACYS0D_01555 [Planctomycetota bacterium]